MSKSTSTSAAARTAAADDAPALPDFRPGTLYDIQLTRDVEFPPGSKNFLRPGETHHLDGEWAAGMKEHISGAVAVEA